MKDGIVMVSTYFISIAIVIFGLIMILMFDDGIVYMGAMLFLLSFTIGLIVLSGHGTGLIAGINTMDEDERSEYDLKKISRSVGLLMIICSFTMLTLAVYRPLFIPSLVFMIASTAVVLWYVNTRCKLENNNH